MIFRLLRMESKIWLCLFILIIHSDNFIAHITSLQILTKAIIIQYQLRINFSIFNEFNLDTDAYNNQIFRIV